MSSDGWTKSKKRVTLEGVGLIVAGATIWILDTFIQSLHTNPINQVGIFTLAWFIGFILIGVGAGVILVKYDLWGY